MAKRFLAGAFLLALLFLASAACQGTDSGVLSVGDPAPDFTLPSANGLQVALSQFAAKQDVLLYFHMAYG